MYYETEHDRENAREVFESWLRAIEKETGYSPETIELPPYHHFDFAIGSSVSGSFFPLAWIEVKTRSNASTKYPSLLIENMKFETIQNEHSEGRMIFILVKFTDGIFAYRYNPRHAITEALGGRIDRDNPADFGFNRYIPMEHFRKIM